MGSPDLDMNFIRLQVFPLSLTEYAAVWFSEVTYNSINTWDLLRDVFLENYDRVSNKINHKNKVNNFVDYRKSW